MGQLETKTMLDAETQSDTLGDIVSFTVAFGTVTFQAWAEFEEGGELGDNNIFILGTNSPEQDHWLELGEIVLSALESEDSFVITDAYKFYRALTGTIAEDNSVTVIGTAKGPDKD